jgi:hypothetical protein
VTIFVATTAAAKPLIIAAAFATEHSAETAIKTIPNLKNLPNQAV